MESIALDAAGHRRSPATMPGYHQARPPRNKGVRYPADPPTIEEIVAVMRVAGEKPDGLRLRALIVPLWRAGLRIGEALALAETDLDQSRVAVLVRRGKGGKRREVGMDRWAWQQLDPWLEFLDGPGARTRGVSIVIVHVRGSSAKRAIRSTSEPIALTGCRVIRSERRTASVSARPPSMSTA
jgi:integrase